MAKISGVMYPPPLYSSHSNMSIWWSSQYNIQKDVTRVPNKSLGKFVILYTEYDSPETGKALTESNFFEMFKHHHGIANIEVTMAKQGLHKDIGLVEGEQTP